MTGKIMDIREEIKKVIKESPIEEDPGHSETTLQRLLKLKPDADEALQIAALAHDIERGVTKKSETSLKDYKNGYAEYKKQHASMSAKIISEMLQKHGYDDKFVEKVKKLVENHEVGGDPETDVLRDADSLSFFSYNLSFNLKRNGREIAKEKIKFMYSRMSKRAKDIAQKIDFANEELTKLFKEAISET